MTDTSSERVAGIVDTLRKEATAFKAAAESIGHGYTLFWKGHDDARTCREIADLIEALAKERDEAREVKHG